MIVYKFPIHYVYKLTSWVTQIRKILIFGKFSNVKWLPVGHLRSDPSQTFYTDTFNDSLQLPNSLCIQIMIFKKMLFLGFLGPNLHNLRTRKKPGWYVKCHIILSFKTKNFAPTKYGLVRIGKNLSFSGLDRIQILCKKCLPVGHFLSDFDEIWTQIINMQYITEYQKFESIQQLLEFAREPKMSI